MRFLLGIIHTAALAAVLLAHPFALAADAGGSFPPKFDSDSSIVPSTVDAVVVFDALAGKSEGDSRRSGSAFVAVEIDLDSSPGFSIDLRGDRLEARYRMAFNNIAEGWSWRPLADPLTEDYYHAKFLPLKSVLSERGEYMAEDKVGELQRMQVIWRYDYFLAFDNLYDFYPRSVESDAGFVASLPVIGASDSIQMVAVARLVEPHYSESTTFWKATYGKPTDFTLKKRYLHGQLEAVLFRSRSDGRILARLTRQ